MIKKYKFLSTEAPSLMIAFILVGWIGIASAQAAPAETDSGAVVQSLRIRGIRHFSQAELAETMGIKTGNPLPRDWPDRPVGLMLERYRAGGFFYASVDSIRLERTEAGRIRVEILMHEGKKAEVGRIGLSGADESELKKLRPLIELRSGSAFDESALKRDIDRILSYCEDNGRPLASLSIRSLEPSTDSDDTRLDIRLDVHEGPRVLIRSIRPEGNSLTRAPVILRETRLKSGIPFRLRDIRAARENLQKLGFFREVSEPRIRFSGDSAEVVFPVQEGSTNTFDGVIGYNPPKTEDERGYFTGRLEFGFQNLFGTGRRLDAYWEKKDRRTQTIRFGYEEPWLFGLPVFPGLKFTQEIRDTTYVERAWQVSARAAPWSALSAGVEAGQKQILPDSIGSVMLRVPQTSTWFVSAALDYNTLDDPFNPRRGIRYRTAALFGRKHNLGPAFLLAEDQLPVRTHTRQISIDAEILVATLARQAVYAGLHGRDVRTGEKAVPLADQIRFGGALTVRGYEEDAFRGSTAAWVNLEYRYLFGRRSRSFVFVDAGTFQRREVSGTLTRGTKVGYGIGIRLETKLGVMGVDYGLGEGDGLSRGKVHVGLKNAF
jgi:outer membrane protein assembly factor BamA